MLKYMYLCVLAYASLAAAHPERYITSKLQGQTGNLCFEIAAAKALAWDNDAEAYFPDLNLCPKDFEHLFFRCKVRPPSRVISGIAREIFPQVFKNKVRLEGYFQSEKYFAHHREKILELFAPSDTALAYIKAKYQWILDTPNSVGVQLRYYRKEVVDGYPQYGVRYLEKAMAYFPSETLFIVSSDNIEYAKQNIPSWATNVYFLENESPYTDLFILSLCKHNIISNSTFGWWAAWLNRNPEKIVLCPKYWTDYAANSILPVCPEEWIHIEAEPETFD